MKNLSKTSLLVTIGIIVIALVMLSGALTPNKDRGGKHHDRSLPFVMTGSDVSITENIGNVYALTERLSIDTPLNGDIHAIGTVFSVTNQVFGDIGFLGDTLDAQKNVNGDIRAVANRVAIQQNVGGEIMFFGTFLDIAKEGVVRGDILASAEKHVIEGRVQGNVWASGNRLDIKGTVTGDVDATRVKELVIHDGAIIQGSLTYKDSPHKTFVMNDGASVIGETIAISKKRKSSMMHHQLRGIISMLVFLIASSFLMYGLFLRRQNTLTQLSVKRTLLYIVVGLGSVVASFIISIVLAMTPGLGFISLALLLAILLLTLLSMFAAPILLGILTQRLMRSKEGITVKTVVTGIAVTLILMTILKPLAFFVLYALGALFIGYCIHLLIGSTQDKK